MSTIKTNTLTGTSTAGSILVTGEGGSTTTNLQQGLCKGWASVQLDDTVMDNLNLTTFTDNGVGDITHNFVNPMGNINFVSIGGNIRNNDGGVAWCGGYGSDSEADIKNTTGETRIYHLNASNVPEDMRRAMVAVHGDLA